MPQNSHPPATVRTLPQRFQHFLRCQILALILALSVNNAFCAMGTMASESSQPPVNVLMIVVDDLKPALGSYNEPVVSPNIDRLAEAGLLFTNAHCQQAVCGPSRTSALTGQLPDRLRIWDLKAKLRDRNPSVVSLPEHFRNHGYITAGVGKVFDGRNVDSQRDGPSWTIPFADSWKLPYFDPETGPPAGGHYQAERIHELEREANRLYDGAWRGRKRHLKENGGWPAWERMDVSDHAYEAGAIADQGIAWIDDLSEDASPFFVTVGFKKPHLPFVAPEKYWELYDPTKIELAPFQAQAAGSPDFAYHNFGELRAYSGIPKKGPLPEEMQRTLIHAYFATISYVDAQIGRILTALEASPAAENTVVVLWGDHGWHLGDHGLWCKHSNFEQATRIPLILSGSGISDRGQRDDPVELLGLFPTLLELADLPFEGILDGRSWLQPTTSPAYAFSQYPRGGKMGYTLRDADLRYVAWYPAETDTLAETKRAPLVEELYDYRVDPLETQNRIDDPRYAADVERMRAAIRTRFLP